MNKYLMLLFIIILLKVTNLYATELQTIASYDGTNVNIKNSISGEKVYFSFQRGANNETNYYSILLKDKKMVEINEETYYIINYSGQFDSDRVVEDNSFIKAKSELKLAKYISSNLFLNMYIEAEYKNYYMYFLGESLRGAAKVEFKFPKNNMNLNIKVDGKYFTNKTQTEVEEIIINTDINNMTTTTSAIVNKSFPRRIVKGVEVSIDKTINENVYCELYSYYGKTNNNVNYGNKDYQKATLPDITNEELSITYGYLSWNVYNGDMGSFTMYGMYERDIAIATMTYQDYVTNGFVYGKGGIKWIGEVGVTGSYDYSSDGYSLSTYIKKSF